MLWKWFRLTGRSVSFLLSSKRRFRGHYFVFSYAPVRGVVHHHRCSFHVSKKIHKSSVVRHLIKRSVLNYCLRQDFFFVPIHGKYLDVFLHCNPHSYDLWKWFVDNKPRKDIVQNVSLRFASDLARFIDKVSF